MEICRQDVTLRGIASRSCVPFLVFLRLFLFPVDFEVQALYPAGVALAVHALYPERAIRFLSFASLVFVLYYVGGRHVRSERHSRRGASGADRSTSRARS